MTPRLAQMREEMRERLRQIEIGPLVALAEARNLERWIAALDVEIAHRTPPDIEALARFVTTMDVPEEF